MGGRTVTGGALVAVVLAITATRAAPGPATATASDAGPVELVGTRVRLPLPADWRLLPVLGGEPSTGDATGAAIERYGAGDPASGCYALLQVTSADDAATVAGLHEAMAAALAMAGLAAEPQRAAEHAATVAPALPAAAASATRSTIPVRGGGIEGVLISELRAAPGQATAAMSLACFHDLREPLWCRRQCDELVAAFGAAP